MVRLVKQKAGGLGLSVKGGVEHNLPILVSKVFKDQPADISGQVFIGDAIVKGNLIVGSLLIFNRQLIVVALIQKSLVA